MWGDVIEHPAAARRLFGRRSLAMFAAVVVLGTFPIGCGSSQKSNEDDAVEVAIECGATCEDRVLLDGGIDLARDLQVTLSLVGAARLQLQRAEVVVHGSVGRCQLEGLRELLGGGVGRREGRLHGARLAALRAVGHPPLELAGHRRSATQCGRK